MEQGGPIGSIKAWLAKGAPLLSISFCMLLVSMFVATFFAYLHSGVGLALSSSVKLILSLILLFLPTIVSSRYDRFSALALCNVTIGWIPPVWIGLLIWGIAIRRQEKKENSSPSSYELRDWIRPVLAFSLCLAILSLLLGWLVYFYYQSTLPDRYFAGFFSVFEWHFIMLLFCFTAALLVAFIPKLKTGLSRMLVVCVSVLLLSSFVFSSSLTFLKQGEYREDLERFSSEVFRKLAQVYKEEGRYPVSLTDVSPAFETPAVFDREGVYRNHGEYFELHLGTEYQAVRFDSRIGVWQTCIGESCY